MMLRARYRGGENRTRPVRGMAGGSYAPAGSGTGREPWSWRGRAVVFVAHLIGLPVGSLGRRCRMAAAALLYGAALLGYPSMAQSIEEVHTRRWSPEREPAPGWAVVKERVATHRETWRSQGFYDTSERMGVGLRLDSARTTFEFTWARLPRRRLSLGLWAEANWLETQPEQTYASGGGLEVTIFPMLPARWKPWGVYLEARVGGIQNYTRTYQRQGGEARVHAEAGWFGHAGRSHFLIPKAAVRRTWLYDFRYRKQTGEITLDRVLLGLEAKVGRVVPGVSVLFGDGRTVWMGSLRFAYRDPAPRPS